MLNPKRIIIPNICFINRFHLLSSPVIIKIFILFFIILNILSEVYAIPGYKKRTVIFGGDSSFPPYEYLDQNNVPQGYSVELTMALSEVLNWDARIILVKWEDVLKDLQSGKIHLIEKAVYTSERSKIWNYSVPYHEFRYFIFINNSDRDHFNQHGFKGMNAVVQINSYPHEYVKINIPDVIINVKDRSTDVLAHLSAVNNSFTVMNKYTGLFMTQEKGIKNVIATGKPVQIERYHYISSANNTELITAINEGLNILSSSGKIKEINDRWFAVIKENSEGYNIKIIIFTAIIIAVMLFMLWFIISLKKKNNLPVDYSPDKTDSNILSGNSTAGHGMNPELIIADAPVGLFHFDTKGIITSCNESFAKIAGSTKEKITGFNILSYQDEKLAELARSALQGNPGYYEGDYSAGGRTVHVRSLYIPLIISNNTISGCLGFVEDITERKKYEDSLVAAKDTAESASSIKSHFLANMSHEVRTPLNGILGMLQLLQTTGINEEQSNYVSIAIKSGMRLTRLLNDILELSRVEADKLVLNETQFSLKNIFNFIEERFITECDEKGVKLFLNIHENTPEEIIGDEIRIRQILINLVSNSVKYTKTGQINVDIHTEDISLYGAVNIIISVKDTGIGIAEDMINRIFEPFKQGESLYRRSFQGAGLGLTLVKHLVNIMNGTIKINSTPGKGTSIECSVTVKLPENQAIDIKPVSSEESDRSGNQLTILVAEDERINRLALKRILEKLGYRILEAENGIEVLKILETENPDCILMDIQMPEMDGIETTKLLRDREKYGNKSDTPVIALTAYTLPEDREKIKAAGLDDFISKPVNMDYLIKSISRLVANA